MRIILFFLFIGVFHSENVEAKEVPMQARFFAGNVTVDPKNANTELAANGLEKIDSMTLLGIEATYPVLKFLDFGLRYTKGIVRNEEQTSNPLTDYYVQVEQDSTMLIARIPFYRSSILRLDGFAGYGGSNSKIKLKSATQDGQLTRKGDEGWFATPYSAFGGSLAVGYKRFYIVFEGGVQSNKVDKFDRTGTVNSNISHLDLSGSYISIALMFDGLAGKTK